MVGQTESTIKTITAPLSIPQPGLRQPPSGAGTSRPPHIKPVSVATAYGEKSFRRLQRCLYARIPRPTTVSQGSTVPAPATTRPLPTFRLKKAFSGKGETSYDTGSISYTYRTTDKVDTTALTKDTKNTTTAKAAYNFITVARKNFTVTTPADPEEPTPPQEEEVETPETPETPQTPELPPVQDATPDQVIAPANPELPPVQDATALPQTGVNWMAALGMAFSGMLLTIAGAFASLKYKEKH